MYIGPYQLSNNLIVAPMAGVTDRPFRTLCKYFGAGHAVSEMMTADKTLRMSKKVYIVLILMVSLLQFQHKLQVLIQSNWLKLHVIKSQMARKLLISIWDVLQKSM
jgi:tRNA-dihydrouridine synthase